LVSFSPQENNTFLTDVSLPGPISIQWTFYFLFFSSVPSIRPPSGPPKPLSLMRYHVLYKVLLFLFVPERFRHRLTSPPLRGSFFLSVPLPPPPPPSPPSPQGPPTETTSSSSGPPPFQCLPFSFLVIFYLSPMILPSCSYLFFLLFSSFLNRLPYLGGSFFLRMLTFPVFSLLRFPPFQDIPPFPLLPFYSRTRKTCCCS